MREFEIGAEFILSQLPPWPITLLGLFAAGAAVYALYCVHR